MRLRTDKILQQEIYSLYVALFRARKVCPDDFSKSRLTIIMTAILSIKQYSWRVIGITKEALDKLETVDFDKKKLPRGTLCRGHKVGRAITTESLFCDRDQPLPCNDFVDTVLKNDCTVIMLDEQNRATCPEDFIPIDNPEAELFPNGHAGWEHRKQERDYLRQLHAQPRRSTLP